jgi:solute carrier family 20 (sodium-dependent phosphate transporter)
MPIFYFACIAFNVFTISYQGSKILGFDAVPWWVALAVSILAGLAAAFIVHFLLKPKLTNWIHREFVNS